MPRYQKKCGQTINMAIFGLTMDQTSDFVSYISRVLKLISAHFKFIFWALEHVTGLCMSAQVPKKCGQTINMAIFCPKMDQTSDFVSYISRVLKLISAHFKIIFWALEHVTGLWLSAQVPKKMWPNHKYGHIWPYNRPNIIFCKLYK